MTDVNLNYSNQKSSGNPRQKKLDLKIDMTPMVDLGFLLIAFFIFTTQLSKPNAVNLFMPHDGKPMLIAESNSLTILISNNSALYYYFGEEKDAFKGQLIKQSGYTDNEIGNLIRQKQSAMGERKDDLMVIIKASKNSSYKNVVNVLDEMLINKVKRYAISELGEHESTFLDAR